MAWVAARIAVSVAGVFALAPLAPSVAAASCSSDVFALDGGALAVELCARAAAPRGDGKTAAVTLVESFNFRGRPSYVRRLTLDLDRSAESRTIDDVALAKLGIEKTLHLTIAYKPGSVRLEHALLIPGAVALK
ncbi:MAG: hypothetical protein M3R53_04480 [Candidatus Eremiobacteraeota bacterium]|nr:hypothetical protein [Candidatus Eremiobacteraeota bacterium]